MELETTMSHDRTTRSSAARTAPRASSAAALLGLSVVFGGLFGAGADLVAANPEGETIIAGDVTFVHEGDHLTIYASDGSIIEYLSFDILPWETVQFIQPGDWARVLNRITGPEPTQILGTLLANGHVYIVNPAGVVFGANAVVDAAGLHAAAGHLSNEDFLAGIDRYTNLSGTVVNRGLVEADDVRLLGHRVENHGVIRTDGGVIAMVAGNEIWLQRVGDRISAVVDGRQITDLASAWGAGATPDATAMPGVLNTGTIDANGGHVLLGAGDMYGLAVHNLGTVRSEGGLVEVASTGGAIVNEGLLDASGANGGEIRVTGPSVVNAGEIRADGSSGSAGEILVAGANHTYLLDGSVVSARGTNGADGGRIVLGDGGQLVLESGAEIDARGGANGGDGGHVELAGSAMALQGSIRVDAGAGGAQGTVGLGPFDVVINEAGGDDVLLDGDGAVTFAEIGGAIGDTFIAASTLTNINGAILIQSFGDILVLVPIQLGLSNPLTLEALGDIIVNGDITGAANVTMLAGQSIEINGNVTLALSDEFNSFIQLDAGDSIVVFGDLTLTPNLVDPENLRNDVQMTAGGSIELLGNVTFLGTGTPGNSADLVLTADGDIRLAGSVAGADDVWLLADADLDGDGDLVIDADIAANRDVILDGDRIFLNAASVSAGELIQVWAPTFLGTDLVFTAPIATFASTIDSNPGLAVDGDFTPRSMTVNGEFRLGFGAAVGSTFELADLTVNGDSLLFGYLIRTVGDQTFNGDVVAGVDYTFASLGGGDISFHGTLDSEFGFNGLSVLTAGETLFADTVGGQFGFTYLETDAAGSTVLGGDVFAGNVTFGDDLFLASDVTVAAQNAFFGGFVDGAGFDLVVDASGTTTFDGVVANVDTLETTGGGTTVLGGFIVQAREIVLGDDVVLAESVQIDGEDFVRFGGTIDGTHSLWISAGSLVEIGGSIGASEVLASLVIDVTDPDGDANLVVLHGSLVAANGDIVFLASGLPAPATVATIAATGDLQIVSGAGAVVIGEGHKLTALGDLGLAAGTYLRVGDLNALGDLALEAPVIQLMTRDGGMVLTAAGELVMDLGLELIAGGSIFLSVVPELLGDAPYLLASGTGVFGGAAASAGAILVTAGPTSVDDLRLDGERILDFSVFPEDEGPGPEPETAPEIAFATLFGEDDLARIRPDVVGGEVTAEVLADRSLEDLGLYLRSINAAELAEYASGAAIHQDVAPSGPLGLDEQPATSRHRLRRDRVLAVIDRHAAIFLVGDGGDADTDPRVAIRERFERAWRSLPAGEDFATFLAGSEAYPGASTALAGLQAMFADLAASGATPREVRRAARTVLGPITPDSMDPAVLEAAVLGAG